MFASLEAFIQEFGDHPTDLVVTFEMLYQNKLRSLFTQADAVMLDHYGNQEPSDTMIETMIADVDLKKYRRIIGIGGGAVMDTAKILSVCGSASLDAIFEHPENIERTCKLVLVPTTCGTGSEVTDISAISRTAIHTKVGLSHDSLYADAAILIPELIMDLPRYVFATSSIDALIHAIESYLSGNGTDLSRIFSVAAITRIITGYRSIQENGYQSALEQQAASFLEASCFAGIAFATGGCGLIHAMSYPLGGKYHVAHGEANYMMFMEVMNMYNEVQPLGRMHELKCVLAEGLHCDPSEALPGLELLLEHILKRTPIQDYGFTAEDIQTFSASVISNQQRLLKNSYVPVNHNDIERIYENIYAQGAL